MKLIHRFWLLLSVVIGAWLGQFSSVQDPLLKRLMPPTKAPPTELSGTLYDYFSDHPQLQVSVEKWYEDLSETARVGQLIMPAWTENDDLTELIQTEMIGGLMWLGTEPRVISSPNAIPLLIASDAEPSLLKYRFDNPPFRGETQFIENINDTGKAISRFLQGYGINLNFAPVYDLGVNQSVIGTRAFGTDSDTVIAKSNQLSRVFMGQNIIPTAKHFPGHGLVAEDTHLESATISGKLSELPQFKAAITAQVPVMMVGHLAVNTPTLDTRGQPATVSSKVMKKLLRAEMGFDGVIITDAMNMAAVADIDQAALKALVSGTDIVLMPTTDITDLHELIQEKMTQDSAFAREIEAKVKRVLRLKLVWKLATLEP